MNPDLQGPKQKQADVKTVPAWLAIIAGEESNNKIICKSTHQHLSENCAAVKWLFVICCDAEKNCTHFNKKIQCPKRFRYARDVSHLHSALAVFGTTFSDSHWHSAERTWKFFSCFAFHYCIIKIMHAGVNVCDPGERLARVFALDACIKMLLAKITPTALRHRVRCGAALLLTFQLR
jgi:hypothetical protein